MFEKNINSSPEPRRILVAPLDWGLGHATRCIPIIRELLAMGCEVFIAGETAVAALLQREFPELPILHLQGYRIRYAKIAALLPLRLLIQLPRLLTAIRRENHWLKEIVRSNRIEAVISDNRFGLYHTGIPCVYMTHQLQVQTGFSLTDKLVARLHHAFIKRFQYCWVPDLAGSANLAGRLSHVAHPPSNIRMIGPLSRLEGSKDLSQKKYDLLIILSGPEPQRTMLEERLLAQLENFDGAVLFLRGLPDATAHKGPGAKNQRVKMLKHLPAAELELAISSAKWIICRSGYTTVMDLVKMQAKAILIPTPGQTEQEYLAAHLQEQGYFYTDKQQGFLLRDALDKAEKLAYIPPQLPMETYKIFVQQFLTGVQKFHHAT